MDIVEALRQLDEMNDDHWTADGAPAVDAVRSILGRPASRQEITAAAPLFSRQNLELPDDEEEKASAPDPEPSLEEAFEAPEDEMLDPVSPARLRKMSVEELERMIALGDRMAAVRNKNIEQLQEEINQIRINAKMAKNAIASRNPQETNQAAILAYIRSQTAVRQYRNETARGVLAQIEGLDMGSLTPGAPIDAALRLGRPTALRKK
jgi:hypothetical protein